MAAIFITYDLKSKEKDYEGVIEAIKESSEHWTHYWDSAWLIKSSSTVDEITDKIKPHLEKTDTLLVIEVKKNYQGWLEEKRWKKIREDIFG